MTNLYTLRLTSCTWSKDNVVIIVAFDKIVFINSKVAIFNFTSLKHLNIRQINIWQWINFQNHWWFWNILDHSQTFSVWVASNWNICVTWLNTAKETSNHFKSLTTPDHDWSMIWNIHRSNLVCPRIGTLLKFAICIGFTKIVVNNTIWFLFSYLIDLLNNILNHVTAPTLKFVVNEMNWRKSTIFIQIDKGHQDSKINNRFQGKHTDAFASRINFRFLIHCFSLK